MKKSQIVALVMLVAATTLGSCCSCRKSTQSHTPLKATEWKLEQIGASTVASLLKEKATPTLILAEDGSMGGNGGCNTFGGSFRITPSEAPAHKNTMGEIAFSNVFSTKRYCLNDEVEMAYFSALGSIDSYTIEGNKLFLFSSGELKLVFVASSASGE
jgi:heat shock protein HslJ